MNQDLIQKLKNVKSEWDAASIFQKAYPKLSFVAYEGYVWCPERRLAILLPNYVSGAYGRKKNVISLKGINRWDNEVVEKKMKMIDDILKKA